MAGPLPHMMVAMSLCLIVGAGPGLGAAIARRFQRSHYDIGLVARSHETLQAVAELLDESTEVSTATADAGDPVGLRTALDELAPRMAAMC